MKTFNWGGSPTVQKFSSLSHWQGAWLKADRHGTPGVAETPAFCRQQETN